MDPDLSQQQPSDRNRNVPELKFKLFHRLDIPIADVRRVVFVGDVISDPVWHFYSLFYNSWLNNILSNVCLSLSHVRNLG